jgi:hypothetical protein
MWIETLRDEARLPDGDGIQAREGRPALRLAVFRFRGANARAHHPLSELPLLIGGSGHSMVDGEGVATVSGTLDCRF